jgi:hypothetical protein
MTLLTSLTIAVGCCVLLYYGPGAERVVVFKNTADMRDALVFIAIAATMLVVLIASLTLTTT